MTDNENIPEGCLPFDAERAMYGWPCVDDDGNEAKLVFYDDHNPSDKYRRRYLFVSILGENGCQANWVTQYGLGSVNIYLKKKTKT